EARRHDDAQGQGAEREPDQEHDPVDRRPPLRLGRHAPVDHGERDRHEHEDEPRGGDRLGPPGRRGVFGRVLPDRPPPDQEAQAPPTRWCSNRMPSDPTPNPRKNKYAARYDGRTIPGSTTAPARAAARARAPTIRATRSNPVRKARYVEAVRGYVRAVLIGPAP